MEPAAAQRARPAGAVVGDRDPDVPEDPGALPIAFAGDGRVGEVADAALCRFDLPLPDPTPLSRRAAQLSVKIPRQSRQGATPVVVDSTRLKQLGDSRYSRACERQAKEAHVRAANPNSFTCPVMPQSVRVGQVAPAA